MNKGYVKLFKVDFFYLNNLMMFSTDVIMSCRNLEVIYNIDFIGFFKIDFFFYLMSFYNYSFYNF